MTDIADIKPDTSLYSTRGDRLRALAAVADAQDSGATVQTRHRIEFCPEWSDLHDAAVDSPKFFDYRTKPEPRKPRELWVVYDEKGSRRNVYEFISPGVGAFPLGWTPVRFVEQP